MACRILGLGIGAMKEAAEHFLSALTLRHPDHETPGSSASGIDTGYDRGDDQIWQTLTRTLNAMVNLHSNPA